MFVRGRIAKMKGDPDDMGSAETCMLSRRLMCVKASTTHALVAAGRRQKIWRPPSDAYTTRKLRFSSTKPARPVHTEMEAEVIEPIPGAGISDRTGVRDARC